MVTTREGQKDEAKVDALTEGAAAAMDQIRRQEGVTYAELARRTGYSRSHISSVLRGNCALTLRLMTSVTQAMGWDSMVEFEPPWGGFTFRNLLFKALCIDHNVPVPKIDPSLLSDLCDYTSHKEVRLNLEAAGDIDPSWHVAHVFGHYLCCLHAEADEREGGAEMTDQVADVIARLMIAYPEQP